MNTIVSTHLVLASAEMTPRLFDLDFQLLHDAVLSIIAVFALFLIASHLLFNPVRDMLRKRQEKIKGELDSAAKDMAEAKDLKAEYESRLKDIDKITVKFHFHFLLINYLKIRLIEHRLISQPAMSALADP